MEPNSVSLHADSVFAQIEEESGSSDWIVTVVISRASSQPPLPAQDVDAQLYDVGGTRLTRTESPSGFLVEFGGGLGNSVNARFRFQRTSADLARLDVTYRQQSASFRVVP